MYVAGGTTIMSLTLVSGNTGIYGNVTNILPEAGQLYYKLPTPPGYWLPNSKCFANREPCSSNDNECKDAFSMCLTISGTESNSWAPHPCSMPTFVQVCEWQTDACANEDADACLLGKQIYLLPRVPVDADIFPYQCGPGDRKSTL